MDKLKTHYVDKPWGWEKIWAHTGDYVGKMLHIKPGRRLSRQYHQTKEETIYVLSGTLILEIGRGMDIVTKTLAKDSVYHIEPGVVHRFGSEKGRPPVVLMEVSTPQLDDVVRLEDDFGRIERAPED